MFRNITISLAPDPDFIDHGFLPVRAGSSFFFIFFFSSPYLFFFFFSSMLTVGESGSPALPYLYGTCLLVLVTDVGGGGFALRYISWHLSAISSAENIIIP